MNKRYGCLVCFFLFVLPITSWAIGDLMLSIQQRAKIDLIRSSGVQTTVGETTPVAEIKVNGFYFKSKDGQHKGTVWVNGHQVDNGSLDKNNIVVNSLNESTKLVDLSVKEPNIKIPFKAGQALNVDNGDIRDAFQ